MSPDAGASPDKAERASEEVATYESRLASIDGRLTLLTWLIGVELVLTVGILWRLLPH